MASDYFGYDKQSFDPGNIVGATMVAVSIDNGGGGNLCLVQSASVQYNRNVQPTYELGSDSVWLVAGTSSGDVSISRALGRKGSGSTAFWETFKPQDPCKSTTITIAKGDGACGLDPGRIMCESCLLTSMSSSVQVGSLTVTEDARYTTGKVSIS
jgi:hypothetical protein